MCLITLLAFPLQPFQFQFCSHAPSMLGFPGGSEVKNQPAMQELQEMQVQSLGQEDPLEEGMATYSSILAWRIPMDKGAWPTTVHGVADSNCKIMS